MPLTKIQSLGITDGTIVNADINASAAIAGTKLTGVGKVLQVITATDSTERSTTSTSYVTGSNTLSVAITPSSASNKILILLSASCFQYTRGYFALFRDSTNLTNTTHAILYNDYVAGNSNIYIGYNFLDSPNTTSSRTYQIYMKTDNGSGPAYLNVGNSVGSITCLEIAG
jgi:hypothetical protein